MKKWLFYLFVFCLISGCFSKKEIKYNWPIYQIEETKKDTSGVELKVVFYEYYRQTKKEEIVFFAEKLFKEQAGLYYIKLKKGERARLLKLKKIEIYFQNKYPYKTTKGNAAVVLIDKETRKKEWQTHLGSVDKEGFTANPSWWDVALIKRVPKKDKEK